MGKRTGLILILHINMYTATPVTQRKREPLTPPSSWELPWGDTYPDCNMHNQR